MIQLFFIIHEYKVFTCAKEEKEKKSIISPLHTGYIVLRKWDLVKLARMDL